MSEEKDIKQTPFIKQYLIIKEQYRDCLVFYRMGDFYELFFDDAKTAAGILGVVLTDKNRNKPGGPLPMCGVPFHAYESYLVKLVKAGYKVAICEQMESPAESKKRGTGSIVKRDVVRVVTAGTLTEDTLLTADRHNFLASLVLLGTEASVAWADMSTGDLFVQTVPKKGIPSVMARLDVSEIVVPDLFAENYPEVALGMDGLTEYPASLFTYTAQKNVVADFFADKSFYEDSFERADVTAVGVLLSYVRDTQKGNMPCFKTPVKVFAEQFLDIDPATRRSLEIMQPLSSDNKDSSLMAVINKTVTGAGGRMLGSYLRAPLLDLDVISGRQNQVTFFLQNREIRENCRQIMREISDIERSLSRLAVGRGGPKDMRAVAEGLDKIPTLRVGINTEYIPESLDRCLLAMGDHTGLVNQIDRCITPKDTPAYARDGGFVLEGYSLELDELRDLKKNQRNQINTMQIRYVEMTGISGLKILFNNIVGYFIEVPVKSAEIVYAHPEWGFIHRQSMVNSVRFITEELSVLAGKVLSADSEILKTELEIYESLRAMILADADKILSAAEALAELDVVMALAVMAEENRWVRPVLTHGLEFDIKGGRHPVVEDALKKEKTAFVPNDCFLGSDEEKLWLLTGPNMAGKSTFLRQNALIAILAQIGSYVPADEATIGVVDKIFSRVGASDDLAKGRSTFMVEMVEVSAILKGATERSLVILDEVGRGTATFDGLSLAWAVVEYLRTYNKSRGLFATHYHELTVLANRLPGVALYTMRVKEWQGDIVFMHEIGAGATDRSYGIHVAKLAGLPEVVLKRADEVLQQLEEKKQNQKPLFDDLPLFSAVVDTTYHNKVSEIEEKLKEIDVDSLSPREALTFVYQLKQMVG